MQAIVTGPEAAHILFMLPIRIRQWRWKRRRPFLAFGAFALVFFTAACASNAPLYVPLQATGSYGYADERVGPTRYKVSYAAPSATSSGFSRAQNERDAEPRVGLAYDMALWRSSELALQDGFPAFKVSDRSNDISIDHRYYYYDDPFYHSCFGPFAWRFHCISPYYGAPYYDRYALINVRVTLTIDLEREIRPGTFDAQDAIAKLRAHYPTALTTGQPAAQGTGY